MGYFSDNLDAKITQEELKVTSLEEYLNDATMEVSNLFKRLKSQIEVFPKESENNFFSPQNFRRTDKFLSYDIFLNHLSELCIQENVCIRFDLDLESLALVGYEGNSNKPITEYFYIDALGVINNKGKLYEETFITSDLFLVGEDDPPPIIADIHICERENNGYKLRVNSLYSGNYIYYPDTDDLDDDEIEEINSDYVDEFEELLREELNEKKGQVKKNPLSNYYVRK